MTQTIEGVQQTLAEYERIALETRQFRGLRVEFSNDGLTWSEHIFPTADEPHPALAAAVVSRAEADGVVVETRVVFAWAEVVPADVEWLTLWERKPHVMFGAFAARAALRRAFRDFIGDRREPDEVDAAPSAAEPDVDVDWSHEIGMASTVEAVHELHARMKAARAVTPPLEVMLRRQIALLNAKVEAEAQNAPTPPRKNPRRKTADG